MNARDFWGVTSHAMPSNGVPHGNLWCVVVSTGSNNGIVISPEVATSTAAARRPGERQENDRRWPGNPAPPSRTMTVASVGDIRRLDDEDTGMNGAPYIPGQWTQSDFGFFTWADDDQTYFNMNIGVGASLIYNGHTSAFAYTVTDKYHTIFKNLATDWQNGVNNLTFNSVYSGLWFSGGVISVNGAMYSWLLDPANKTNSLSKTVDHYQSTITPGHNVGPTTTDITNMTCTAGSVTATSLLNLTDEFPIISAPGHMAMIVAGAAGTGVNGVFGPVTAVTPTTVTWAQSCSGWSWTGGGTVNVYGIDVPSVSMNSEGGMAAAWIQSDGRDYQGTKIAGMDAFVYFWAHLESDRKIRLCRIRVEDLPTQRDSAWGCYIGAQKGDDGLYDAAWDYSPKRMANATAMNPVEFALRAYGRGSNHPQEIYIPTFNRFLLAYEITSPIDSWGGGTAIYDGGQYPWSKLTLIGHYPRHADLYPASTPQFPQFDARTMAQVDADTVNIGLSLSGGNFFKSDSRTNSYTAYMARDIILKPRGSAAPGRLPLSNQEVLNGLDLAYDFDVPTGSLSMPNKAPSDAKQVWAWTAPDNTSPLWIDQYGSYNFTSASVSLTPALPSSDFLSNVALTTPYAQSLNTSTVLYCFGHHPTTLMTSPPSNAIALQKGQDLRIAWASGNNWAVTFKGTPLGSVAMRG